LQIPIVVLSQLSRESDKRSDHRPQLSDLRDSGSLEQDADVVLFVHRPAVYGETEENRNLAEVHIGKQRNGPTGVVRLGWLNHLTRFENPNHTYPQAVSEHR
jgi:replicative DNA helicase